MVSWKPQYGRMAAALAALFLVEAAAPADAQDFGSSNAPYSRRPTNREYRFGARTYLRELSEDLIREANAVCVEMYSGYQGNPRFRDVYRDAYTLITDAKHIQQLIREGTWRDPRGNEDHIERDLRNLDRLLHSVERDVAGWQIDRRAPGRQNRDTLPRLISDFDRTLNLIMTDYGVRDTTYDRRPHRRHSDMDRGGFPPRR